MSVDISDFFARDSAFSKSRRKQTFTHDDDELKTYRRPIGMPLHSFDDFTDDVLDALMEESLEPADEATQAEVASTLNLIRMKHPDEFGSENRNRNAHNRRYARSALSMAKPLNPADVPTKTANFFFRTLRELALNYIPSPASFATDSVVIRSTRPVSASKAQQRIGLTRIDELAGVPDITDGLPLESERRRSAAELDNCAVLAHACGGFQLFVRTFSDATLLSCLQNPFFNVCTLRGVPRALRYIHILRQIWINLPEDERRDWQVLCDAFVGSSEADLAKFYPTLGNSIEPEILPAQQFSDRLFVNSIDVDKLPCPLCGPTYTRRYAMTELFGHISHAHHSVHLYACQFCSRAFLSIDLLKRHNCEQFTAYLNCFGEDEESFTFNFVYVSLICADCGFHFLLTPRCDEESFTSSFINCLLAHNSNSFVVFLVYSADELSDRHIRLGFNRTFPNAELRCKYCNDEAPNSFLSKSSNSIDNGPVFSNVFDLDKHLRMNHKKDITPMKCHRCPASFYSIDVYKDHILSHLQELPMITSFLDTAPIFPPLLEKRNLVVRVANRIYDGRHNKDDDNEKEDASEKTNDKSVSTPVPTCTAMITEVKMEPMEFDEQDVDQGRINVDVKEEVGEVEYSEELNDMVNATTISTNGIRRSERKRRSAFVPTQESTRKRRCDASQQRQKNKFSVQRESPKVTYTLNDYLSMLNGDSENISLSWLKSHTEVTLLVVFDGRTIVGNTVNGFVLNDNVFECKKCNSVLIGKTCMMNHLQRCYADEISANASAQNSELLSQYTYQLFDSNENLPFSRIGCGHCSSTFCSIVALTKHCVLTHGIALKLHKNNSTIQEAAEIVLQKGWVCTKFDDFLAQEIASSVREADTKNKSGSDVDEDDDDEYVSYLARTSDSSSDSENEEESLISSDVKAVPALLNGDVVDLRSIVNRPLLGEDDVMSDVHDVLRSIVYYVHATVPSPYGSDGEYVMPDWRPQPAPTPLDALICEYCTFSTVSYTELLLHRKMEHTDGKEYGIPRNFKLYLCRSCCYAFNKPQEYNRHMETHAKPTGCKKCSCVSGREIEQQRHSSNHNTRNAIFACTICSIMYTREAMFMLHMVKHHKMELVYFCKTCGVCNTNLGAIFEHIFNEPCRKLLDIDFVGFVDASQVQFLPNSMYWLHRMMSAPTPLDLMTLNECRHNRCLNSRAEPLVSCYKCNCLTTLKDFKARSGLSDDDLVAKVKFNLAEDNEYLSLQDILHEFSKSQRTTTSLFNATDVNIKVKKLVSSAKRKNNNRDENVVINSDKDYSQQSNSNSETLLPAMIRSIQQIPTSSQAHNPFSTARVARVTPRQLNVNQHRIEEGGIVSGLTADVMRAKAIVARRSVPYSQNQNPLGSKLHPMPPTMSYHVRREVKVETNEGQKQPTGGLRSAIPFETTTINRNSLSVAPINHVKTEPNNMENAKSALTKSASYCSSTKTTTTQVKTEPPDDDLMIINEVKRKTHVNKKVPARSPINLAISSEPIRPLYATMRPLVAGKGPGLSAAMSHSIVSPKHSAQRLLATTQTSSGEAIRLRTIPKSMFTIDEMRRLQMPMRQTENSELMRGIIGSRQPSITNIARREPGVTPPIRRITSSIASASALSSLPSSSVSRFRPPMPPVAIPRSARSVPNGFNVSGVTPMRPLLYGGQKLGTLQLPRKGV